jgi:hypothetical protein
MAPLSLADVDIEVGEEPGSKLVAGGEVEPLAAGLVAGIHGAFIGVVDELLLEEKRPGGDVEDKARGGFPVDAEIGAPGGREDIHSAVADDDLCVVGVEPFACLYIELEGWAIGIGNVQLGACDEL